MKGLAAGAAVLVAVSLLAVTAHVGAAAIAIEGDQFSTALAINPNSQTAASSLAEQRLAEKDYTSAKRLSLAALRAAPSDARAVRVLALSYYLQGNVSGAQALMEQGALLGWRDLPTQLWLINQAAAVGDFKVALERADAVGRSRALLPELTPVFRAAMQDDEGRKILTDRMVAMPYWRPFLLARVDDLTPGDEAAYEQMFDALAKAGSPPARRELLLYVRRLAGRGDYAHAFAIWQKHVARTARLGWVNDGDFTQLAKRVDNDSFPFEWDTNVQNPGAEVSIVGKSVRITSDSATSEHLLRQTLLLAPGKYRVRTHLAAMTVVDTAGARWTMTCLGSNLALVPASSDAGKGIEGHFEGLNPVFMVPPTGCLAQLLEIRTEPQETSAATDFTIEKASIDLVG